VVVGLGRFEFEVGVSSSGLDVVGVRRRRGVHFLSFFSGRIRIRGRGGEELIL